MDYLTRAYDGSQSVSFFGNLFQSFWEDIFVGSSMKWVELKTVAQMPIIWIKKLIVQHIIVMLLFIADNTQSND